MARRKGTLSLSSNLNVLTSAPLDPRELVETMEDLTDPNSWDYTYVGMKTYVKSAQKWYTLRYDDPTNISSWAEETQGADGKDGLPIVIDSVTRSGREVTITLVYVDPEGADHSVDVVLYDGKGEPGEKGEKGDQGLPGADGQSFTISAQYNSEQELKTAHPTGKQGDAYFVKNEDDGVLDVYVWLSETNEWSNIGPLQGGRGPQGNPGAKGDDGFSPTITIAETSDGSYKLRITNKDGSFETPNLKGNMAPIDTISSNSASPVQSSAIKAALDEKQDKTLATPVGVRNYSTGEVVNQTTVQTTLEALAQSFNYIETPVQMIPSVQSVEALPKNIKPNTICVVKEQGEPPVAYITEDGNTWTILGGGGVSNATEISSDEVDQIWNDVINGKNNDPNNDPSNTTNDDNNSGNDDTNTNNDNGGNDNTNINNSFALNKMQEVSEIPFEEQVQDYFCQNMVSYNGNLHYISISKSDSGPKKNEHYIYDETQWIKKNDPPFTVGGYCSYIDLLVYNEELYAIGGNSYGSIFYKWNSSTDTWDSVASVPYTYYMGEACVYDNDIYIFGGNKSGTYGNFYKWDGVKWTKLSNIPYADSNWSEQICKAEVFDNKIYVAAPTPDTSKAGLYTWDGTTWERIDDRQSLTLNQNTTWYNSHMNFIAYNNKLYGFGNNDINDSHTNYSILEENGWNEDVQTLPLEIGRGHAITVHNNKIYALSLNNKLYTLEL